MTKEEAIIAMQKGEKVTHKYFLSNEWATMKNGKILLEGGVECSSFEFWQFRYQEWWDTDWSLFRK